MNLELAEMFSVLKLKYALESYKALNSDPNLLEKLSLDDALSTILSAEITSRESNHQAMLLRMARIPLLGDLSDISYDDERGQQFVKVMAGLKSMEWIKNAQNLCIYGASGTGKSYLSSVFAREAVRKGLSVLYCNAADLQAELVVKKNSGRHDYGLMRKNLLNKKLLIIDDFCLRAPDDAEQSVLFDILNDRTGKRSTLVTSQKDRNLWIEDMKITPMAESIAERLCANAWNLVLEGNSRRKTLN